MQPDTTIKLQRARPEGAKGVVRASDDGTYWATKDILLPLFIVSAGEAVENVCDFSAAFALVVTASNSVVIAHYKNPDNYAANYKC